MENDKNTLLTTGELAKLCNVSVRTVQYYDTRGILIPSALSEGGRRLYSKQDANKMKLICLLRDAGLPISSIKQLFEEEQPEKTIDLLLAKQQESIRSEIEKQKQSLQLLSDLQKEIKSAENIDMDAIAGMTQKVKSKKNLRKLHTNLLLMGIPLEVLEWAMIIWCVFCKIWWPLLIYVAVAVPAAIWISNYYFERVEYICPHCSTVFSPSKKEALFARHTPTLRKLHCPECGKHSFCVEIYKTKEFDDERA